MATRTARRIESIRDKVEFLSELFTDTPEAARVNVPCATAILESGLAFRTVHPDGSSIASDMPIALGGTERAPSPGWLLSAAVASCHATVIAMRAAQLGIELSTLEVCVAADGDARGLLGVGDDVSAAMSGFRIVVWIDAETAPADELKEIVRWATAHSPVVSTACATVPVEVEILPG